MTQQKELSPEEREHKRYETWSKRKDRLFRGKRAIKRIIGGKTYNTATSTIIALDWNGFDPGDMSNYIIPDYDVAEALFKSRHGSYFLASYNQWLEDSLDRRAESIQALSPTEAQLWLEENFPDRPDLIETEFGEMPEAGDTESRFTLRMPDSLRRRIDALSEVTGQSTNAWIIACLERCSSTQERETRT